MTSREDSSMPVVDMPGNRPFAPRVSGFTRPFWDALGAGRLCTTRCADCGAFGFPPRNLCRTCWSRTVRWVELAPHGRLYSFTRVHVVPGAFAGDAPYAIGIVDLADGVRLMCRMLGEVTADHLDRPVEMVVLRYDDGPLFGARVV
ncbi:MAG TPA: Zn-ribbon domain-containing OB-fold protein [Quisquiliibacterium sp.]|nr:Zn-ribbon domain-containing OB-fold protein [Quisquiliibacterium sp.]HQN13734.1 Zn-ribbon domain-containing OB-fold protein [Quisquiliibacterium sp.]HQP65390.1 Zn-ribbon domain-containing OB-fold protein [Quisquiliibacterium sp.]